MIIEITSSGGFGGLPAAGMNKTVDVASQPPVLAQEICIAFAPEHLHKLSGMAMPEGAADMMTYRIVVKDDKGEHAVFELREDQLPPEMLDLIDRM